MPNSKSPHDDLKAVLLKSTAIQSLVQEGGVARHLGKHGWDVVHGYFYSDQVTQKIREVDLYATQSWRESAKPLDNVLNLHLVVECKSLKGFHLVFSDAPRHRAINSLQGYWIGWESFNRKRFAKSLLDAGVPYAMLDEVIKKSLEAAYPPPDEFMRASALHVSAPNAHFTASAFRETNIGGEKDLDSSSVWKANLSLQSAVLSCRNVDREGDFEMIQNAIDFTRDIQSFAPVDEIIGQVKKCSASIELYHPVLVTDCQIWKLTSGKLSRIPWCRFFHAGISGIEDWWIDIVAANNMKTYFDATTRHYRDELSSKAVISR